MIDVETMNKLNHDGWAVFEMDCGQDVRGELSEACGAARSAADTLLDIHARLTLPEEVVYGIAIPIPIGNPPTEELQLFQAQRDMRQQGFGRVSAELTRADQPIAEFDDDIEEARDAVDTARALTLAAGNLGLSFFGLDSSQIPRSAAEQAGLHRAQFMHTWYRPGGYLFGPPGQRGHQDTPYRGVTLSRHINPEAIADWTIDNGRGRSKVRQDGNKVVAMTGRANPYHLVEVHRKAPERHAALMRLTGDPLIAFFGGNLNSHRLN